ncbi:ABC transporter substrate-binding protein [Vibrio metschnikovii]|uniref:ABC transporter substrate-binding protein n=1 Tax=Vibrio metschnikovii TaxID=28172 RepID=UPI001C2F9BA0|nr:ABC transporter substrate-binding protein [Vibrio metschnikovii]
MHRWILLCLILGVIPFSTALQASERKLVILTTFSREPLLPLVEEFNRRYNNVEVQIIHRRSQSSVQLLNRSYINNIDLVLSSSPYLMQHLAQSGKLVILPKYMQTPDWFKPYALPNSEQVAVIGYSGAGLMWNQDYLDIHDLPTPREFIDLVDPVYFGHITMSTPARSGTTQMMLESLVAKYGWNQSWDILLRVGANLATASARSFAVSAHIANGQFGIGPTIDSYALIWERKLDHISFIYDESFTLMPTYVAQVKQIGNDKYAKAFIELLMSLSVQNSMENNDFAKHRIQDKSLFNSNFTQLNMSQMMKREEIINALFDLAITKQIPQLKDIMFGLLEMKLQFADQPLILEKIAKIESAVFRIPISEEEVNQFALRLSRTSDSEELQAEQSILFVEKKHEWQKRLEKQLEEANQQLKYLLAEVVK